VPVELEHARAPALVEPGAVAIVTSPPVLAHSERSSPSSPYLHRPAVEVAEDEIPSADCMLH
jgi:hypothetical protein